MRVVYHKQTVADVIDVTSARFQLSLFGRWSELSLTTYCLRENPHAVFTTAMTFAVRPLSNAALQGSILDGMPNGILRIERGSAGNRQQFEQHVTFQPIAGDVFTDLNLRGGGIPAAREVMTSVLRAVESAVETVRQSLRYELAFNARGDALAALNRLYGRVTEHNVRKLLGAIHWRLMFQHAGCDEDQFRVMEGVSAVNPPRYFPVTYLDQTDIPLAGFVGDDPIRRFTRVVQAAEQARRREEEAREREEQAARFAAASAKASELLALVCGPDLAEEFAKTNKITVCSNGYTFVLAPGEWVQCKDRKGRRARLCIHTQGFEVNPIDELVIAYLHIKHKFTQYMQTAVVQGCDAGFEILPKEAA